MDEETNLNTPDAGQSQPTATPKKRYWIAKVTDDTYFSHALTHNLWLMQQQYGEQATGTVTELLNRIKLMHVGDEFLLAERNKLHACGIVVRPSCITAQISTLKEAIKKKAYLYTKGLVSYADSDCFYENFTDLQGEWGQRVDVDRWKYYSVEGISNYGVNEACLSGTTLHSIYEVTEDFFLKKKQELKQLFENGKTGKRMENTDQIIRLLQDKKQIILQGAPGTGKTYSTAELAVAICDDRLNVPLMSREEVMSQYQQLKKEGRIAFTTFHQSMDYEEFVEGLKPQLVDGKSSYHVKPGIFKDICYKALLSTIVLNKKASTNLDFDHVYDDLIEKIKAGKKTSLPSQQAEPQIYGVSENENILFKGIDGNRSTQCVSRQRLKKLFDAYPSGEMPNTNAIKDVLGGCNATRYWTVLNYMHDHMHGEELIEIDPDNLETEEQSSLIRNFLSTIQSEREDKKGKNFVLIIDEINRGNISKILGELITLLEADKRTGCRNEITATLPYSNECFSVPRNLYVIGTMNTADRSVGYIDYAIRRRFGFVTLNASKEAIEYFYISNKLDTDLMAMALDYFSQVSALMKVSSELDKEDLMIGHSYFMASTPEQLRQKMKYEVRPLLLEYFNDGILSIRKDGDEYKKIKEFGEV